MLRPSRLGAIALLIALSSCAASPEADAGLGDDAGARGDSGVDRDGGSPRTDAGLDAGGLDAGGLDAGTPDAGTPDAGFDAGGPTEPPAPDLATVRWLHTDVSGWPATATLSSVTFRSGTICLDYDRADVWPSVFTVGADVVGNPWVFIQRDGTWYAATWEWLRPGQHCKAMTSVAGDHIKRAPFDAASGWRPSSGEVLYFMVSGLARSSERNAMERTNLVRVVWP